MGRFLRITLEHDESTALYRSILNNISRILWLTEFPLFVRRETAQANFTDSILLEKFAFFESVADSS